MKRFVNLNNDINHDKRVYVSGDKVVFSLYEFKSMFGLFHGVRVSQIDMCDAKLKQEKFSNRLKILKVQKTVGKNFKKKQGSCY